MTKSPHSSSGPTHNQPLRLATTASILETGLLEKLITEFELQTGQGITTSAVGTGHALRLGRMGEADVVLVHDPIREMQFVEAGHGVNRREVMTNDFVLVGPPNDPAKCFGQRTIHDALEAIERKQALFFSRADDSGTNLRELDLWAEATQPPFGKTWYRAASGGMTHCLETAHQTGGYTLSDRGTFLAKGDAMNLKVVCDDPRHLRNPYSVIAVNPARHEGVNYEGAMAWITFLTGASGQSIVAAFRHGKHPLFHPIWQPGENHSAAAKSTKGPAKKKTSGSAQKIAKKPVISKAKNTAKTSRKASGKPAEKSLLEHPTTAKRRKGGGLGLVR